MFLAERGLLRSFVLGTGFATVLVIISILFYGNNMADPMAISETAISQQTLGDSDAQAVTLHKSPEMGQVDETPRDCKPRKNFIFIKTHKTGSSSITNILQRYALYHKLIVMEPTCRKCSLGWPTSPDPRMYLKSKNGKYNAIVHHARYNRTWMDSKFPSDTAYITVIREPLSHLKSGFNYWHLIGKVVQKKWKQPGITSPLQPFLWNPFEHRYVQGFKSCEITFERTRNFQAFDLGYSLEWADDLEKAERFLADLERELTLVMILEHFDESLVLLRRRMCWQMKDILYDKTPKKRASYSYKNYKPTEKERANFKEFSKVDHMLYEFFNKSLWKQIDLEGPAFFAEVKYYKQLNTQVSKHCSDIRKKKRIVVPASKWNAEFPIDETFCYRLRVKRTTYLDGPLRARLVGNRRRNKKHPGRCEGEYVVMKGKTREL
ncbi:galactose-3-O-sulfotransferase 2-like isoform X2 [Branchiostoma lanceolatum]|uniref:galactose-3-O-sulfotransferase 2-like isoform X2 n=1 Tax=Branchiostoma lanceolatum TaxID=7740 RepID=UPI003452FEFC